MIALIIGLALGATCAFLGFIMDEPKTALKWWILGLVLAIIGIALYPTTNVWQRQMAGQAQLREAEWNRQIRVEEARAESEAAKLFANAEVERARGVAEANEIIANGLGGPDGYLRYLYIQAIDKASQQGSSQFIYLPTEAGLPITEAGRAVTQ